MIIAEAVRRYRQEEKLSLRELAQMTGVSAPTIEWIERAALVPKLATLQRIAKLLQWTPEELAIAVWDLPDESPRFTSGQPARGRAARLQARARAEQLPVGGEDRDRHRDDLSADHQQDRADVVVAQPAGEVLSVDSDRVRPDPDV